MSYKQTGKIDLHKALKTVTVCGLVGLGVAAGKVALNEPWHAEKVELAPGQTVPAPSTTKGDIASALAWGAFIMAGVKVFKGKENDLGRDAKIVDGAVQKSVGKPVKMEVYGPNKGEDGVHRLSAFELAQMRNAGNAK